MKCYNDCSPFLCAWSLGLKGLLSPNTHLFQSPLQMNSAGNYNSYIMQICELRKMECVQKDNNVK